MSGNMGEVNCFNFARYAQTRKRNFGDMFVWSVSFRAAKLSCNVLRYEVLFFISDSVLYRSLQSFRTNVL